MNYKRFSLIGLIAIISIMTLLFTFYLTGNIESRFFYLIKNILQFSLLAIIVITIFMKNSETKKNNTMSDKPTSEEQKGLQISFNYLMTAQQVLLIIIYFIIQAALYLLCIMGKLEFNYLLLIQSWLIAIFTLPILVWELIKDYKTPKKDYDEEGNR